MTDGQTWTLLVLCSPVVSALAAGAMSAQHKRRGVTIPVAVIGSVALLLIGNLFVGKPDEWALVLLVSIPWLPFLLGGAFVGDWLGRLSSRGRL